jgi:small subunit ribosomal protein S1
MVNRNLIRGLDLDKQAWEQELEEAFEGTDPDQLVYTEGGVTLNKVVEGRVLRIDGDVVLVDVGYKSEGTIPLSEWGEEEEPPQPGQKVKVLVEELEDMVGVRDDGAMLSLSKRKAERIAAWEDVMKNVHEGDVVTGTVNRQIKGGLLVDIGGVNVFLPASQLDVRRVPDIRDFLGRTIQCVVLKIDESRRNIVVSRR